MDTFCVLISWLSSKPSLFSPLSWGNQGKVHTHFSDYMCSDHMVEQSWDRASELIWTWLGSCKSHLGQSISHSLQQWHWRGCYLVPAPGAGLCSRTRYLLNSTGWVFFFHSEWAWLNWLDSFHHSFIRIASLCSAGLSTATSATIAGEGHVRKFLGFA